MAAPLILHQRQSLSVPQEYIIAAMLKLWVMTHLWVASEFRVSP